MNTVPSVLNNQSPSTSKTIKLSECFHKDFPIGVLELIKWLLRKIIGTINSQL